MNTKRNVIMNLTGDKKRVYLYAKKQGVDIYKYIRAGFDADELEQICVGLEKDVNVNCYAVPAFTSLQMRQIRLGLEYYICVSFYAIP